MSILNFKYLALFLLVACSKNELTYLKQETKVIKKDLTQVVTVAGKLEAAKVASLVAPYDGYVRKIFVQVGQLLKKGDPVLSVSSNLEDSSSFFPMRAPFAGKVTQIATKEGQYVRGGAQGEKTLVRIEDVSQFELEVEVPELDLPKLKVGQDAKVKLASIPGKEFPGKIKNISLSPKENTSKGWGDDTQSRYRVAIELLEQASEFKSGLSAVVDIQSDSRKQTLTLPGEFLTEFEGSEAVKLKAGSFKKIKVGLRTDDSFEVMDGLKEGETVIMDDLVGQAR